MADPLILLDDARAEGASPARLYRDPVEVVVAHRPEEVEPALARIEALHRKGRHLAGYLAYEAGLAFEPRLAPLAAARAGAAGPLVWFGAFDRFEEIASDAVPGWLAEHAPASSWLGPMDPQVSPGAYASAFAALQEVIVAGDIYQTNLTLPLAGSWRGDPLALYVALRPAAAAGYGGVIHDGANWLLSFSPELFFALKESAVTARPMKGTRPRGTDPEQDAALALELAASEKDRAENLMIVDLLRNDLSRIAQPGSVRVEAPFAVESYPTVHQMVTTVRARLREGLGALDVLRALFPCGSITGAPKIRAMELIGAVERDARGPYCGAIGRIDPAGKDGAGDAAFNVAIRTLRLVAGENGGGKAILGVGSAIVADSDWLTEWRECLVKGSFVRTPVSVQDQTVRDQTGATVAGFDLIETMAAVPGKGVELLGLHLDRIEESGHTFGFALDRGELQHAVEAMTRDLAAPTRVRLMVSRSGAYTLEEGPPPVALPSPVSCAVLRLPVDSGDWRLRHKTSDRGFYEAARERAQAVGAAEAILLRDDGTVTEGSFTNLFVEREGVLLTPPVALGLLPGVLRRSLLMLGRAREAVLTLEDLADGFLIGNALRGLMPAVLIDPPASTKGAL